MGRDAEEAGLPNRPSFLLIDAGNMSFDGSTLDLVVSTGSLHHWRDPAKVVGEIGRVLRRGEWVWIFELWREAPGCLIDRRLEECGYGGLTRALLKLIMRVHSVFKEEVSDLLSKSEIFGEHKVEWG